MMGDVLEEHEGRLDVADDAGDMRPEMARVVRAPALARVESEVCAQSSVRVGHLYGHAPPDAKRCSRHLSDEERTACRA